MANRKMIFSKTKTAHSLVKQLGVSAAFLMAATDAGALGLGALEVQSNLDQPLNGTIELRSSTNDDVSSLQASIASREDFESLGIDYPSYLDNLRLSIEDGASGKVLRVNSSGVIIKEPFIHFLVRVNWSGGSFLREYTALIDPPIYAAETPKVLAEPRVVGTDQSYEGSDSSVETDSSNVEDEVVLNDSPVQGSAESIETRDADNETLIEDDFYQSPEVSVAGSSNDGLTLPDDGARYGPVARGESLSLIAQELQRQFPDLSIYSIMKVLFEENPDAFIDNNINGLIQGKILNVGDLNAIRQLDVVQSREFFRAQVAEWDPSVLSPKKTDSVNVGQDEYAFNEDAFNDSSTSDTTTQDSFQIGASSETDDFVSSDQGDSRAGEVLALRQQLSDLQSSLASSELENQELKERISLLEGQVADLNRLSELSIESADMAGVESALAKQNDVEDTSTLDGDVDDVLIDDEVSDATGDELLTDSEELVDDTLDGELTDDVLLDDEVDSAIEETDPVVSSEDVTQAQAPSISSPKPQSFLDKAKGALFDGGLWKVLAGIGALLAAGLGLLMLRRRRADEEFEISMLSIESNSESIDSTQSQSRSHSTSQSMSASVATVSEAVPDKETSFLTVYSDSDAVVQADEVDPVAEADVYIAYGRDEQAEEVLLDGIASQPERLDIKRKLLGLYHKNENSEGFERLAEELYSQKEILTGEIWSEVCEMGKEIAPSNPLFGLSVDDLSAAETVKIDDLASDDEVVSDGAAVSDPTVSELADDEISFEDAIQDTVVETSDDAAAVKDTELDVDDSVSGVDDSVSGVDDSVSDVDDSVLELVDPSDDSGDDDTSIHLINFDEDRSEVSELDEVEIDALDLDTGDDVSDVIEFADSALDGVESDDSDSPDEIELDHDESSDSLVEIKLDDDEEDGLDFSTQSSIDVADSTDLEEPSIDSVQEVSDLEIDPDYDEARTQYELAKVFVDLGDEDGARKILNELVANDDNDEAVLSDARELLKSISS